MNVTDLRRRARQLARPLDCRTHFLQIRVHVQETDQRKLGQIAEAINQPGSQFLDGPPAETAQPDDQGGAQGAGIRQVHRDSEVRHFLGQLLGGHHSDVTVLTIAVGTAFIGGKLTGVYVTYYNHRWSQLPEGSIPSSACSQTGALGMAGPSIPTSNWPAFIRATLACGAATVTGHAPIDGVETVRITGSPITVKLPPGEARAVREKWVRSRWTLYVNPQTYLPVRVSGSSRTFGGPAPSTYSTSVTDMRWLPPTAANIAQTLITIPAGFQQVSSPADQ